MEQEIIDLRDQVESKDRELKRAKREIERCMREIAMLKEEVSILAPSGSLSSLLLFD
jgi:chromosome segregation ATPase